MKYLSAKEEEAFRNNLINAFRIGIMQSVMDCDTRGEIAAIIDGEIERMGNIYKDLVTPLEETGEYESLDNMVNEMADEISNTYQGKVQYLTALKEREFRRLLIKQYCAK